MSPNNQGSPPSWDALVLVAHHLDPKTLAIASFVSNTLDLLWQPLCTAHFPSISTHKITNRSISSRRLYSIGYIAAKRRTNLPLNPVFHLKNLIFTITLCSKTFTAPIATVAKPANEVLVDSNHQLFKFDIDIERGFLNRREGWFSEELPSPGCCSRGVGSGIVVDLKLGFGRGRSGVEKMSVDMLSTVNWRYLGLEDGLRHLQHFLLPCDACEKVNFPADSSSLGGEKGNIHRGMMMAVTEFLAMEDFDLMVEAVGVEEKE
ncbi:hypothetical protein SLEP1_g49146 [Rubroshorea leprosula]|uniref:F-box protein n=1 Tax=Rubroshorea leprosula TaxID=152421 RepID=A0AAV5LWT2_9ROSI|nr:hypothetical protein SLEP1_g49146 [Rubroshorea leprosula]